MDIQFYKYQGTGNDFVMIDNRRADFPKNNTKLVAFLCDRRFGIGADGLILLENDKNSDFRMVYYNSDGNLSSMCGNGGRCIVAFANVLGVIGNETNFIATDGPHYAAIVDGVVSLQMKDVDDIQITDDFVFVDTGSPHHVQVEKDLDTISIKDLGARIRYSERYSDGGTNVNFVQVESENTFKVRTYERGVEDETLSCGTGVTAVALAMHAIGKTKSQKIQLNVEGGTLQVSFDIHDGKYSNVFLIGAATSVFAGTLAIPDFLVSND